MARAQPNAPFEKLDVAYAALRVGALLAGIVYPFLAHSPPGLREDVLIAFGVFACYGAIVYAAGLGWLRSPAHKHWFYAVLGGFDLCFVLVLMQLTGGVASPFYRALYLWVAMPAFYFGFRTGTIASAIAFCSLIALFDVSTTDPWDVLVKAFGLLLHGPLIGYLIDRDRALLRELQALRAQEPPGEASLATATAPSDAAAEPGSTEPAAAADLKAATR